MSLHKSYDDEEAAQQNFTNASYDTQQTTRAVASRSTRNVSSLNKSQITGGHASITSRKRLITPPLASTSSSSTIRTLKSGGSRSTVKDEFFIPIPVVGNRYTGHASTSAPSRTVSPFSVSFNSSRIPAPSVFLSEDTPGLDNARKSLRRQAPLIDRYVSRRDASNPDAKVSKELSGDRITQRASNPLQEGFRETHADVVPNTDQPGYYFSPSQRQAPSEDLPPALIPELRALAAATASNRAAFSTPQVPSVSSPSTHYSSSTGPWSSRDTTPTSVSSSSPGFVQSSRTKKSPKLRKAAPSTLGTEGYSRYGFKPPPALEEVSSSSSVDNLSNSGNEKQKALSQHRKRSTKKLATSIAPTPPPRNSSSKSRSTQRLRGPTNQGPEIFSLVRTTTLEGDVEKMEAPPSNVATAVEDRLPTEIPRRPSRKGTVELGMHTSPIVQSNLPARSLQGFRRRESVDATNLREPAYDPAPRARGDADIREDSLSHVEGSLRPAPQGRAESRSKLSKLPTKIHSTSTTKVVDASENSANREGREAGRSTMAKISSRLGIFGRRPKTSHEQVDSQEKQDLRKGPAAGTGHEGYGKYARRGRKHSVAAGNSDRERSTGSTSQPSLGRKSSLSSAGGSDIDEFVAQRLRPVIIAGGGGEARPESDVSTIWPTFERASLGDEASAYMTKQLTRLPPRSIASDSLSISATSVASDAPSSIAADSRPTMFSLPFPSQNFPAYAPPSLDGYSTSQSSSFPDGHLAVSPDRSLGRSDLDLKKASKTGGMFKWNLFRRKSRTGESSRQAEGRFEEQSGESTSMSVAVASVSTDKPVPYYAVLDSDDESDGEDVLQDLLEQIYESPYSMPEPTPNPTPELEGLGLRRQYGESVLLPSMPALLEQDARLSRTSPPQQDEAHGPQPSRVVASVPSQPADAKRHRLPHVGRIPRVISRRERQHQPAATSFSRPFQRDTLTNAPKKPILHSATTSGPRRPILGIQTDVLPSRPFSSPEIGQAASAPAEPLRSQRSRDFDSHPEFLVFPGRERSQVPPTSSSGKVSTLARGPLGMSQRYYTQVDEIWNEYDDLLDHVMSPTSSDLALPVASSLRERFGHIMVHPPGQPRHESQVAPEMMQRPMNNVYEYQAQSSRLPPPISLTGTDVDYRLRRSRIVSALGTGSPLSPLSPLSTNERPLGYAGRNLDSTDSGQLFSSDRIIGPGPLLSPVPGPDLALPKLPEVSRRQSTLLLDMAERDREGPTGQSDLRFAALMTSRWLSFGRVLFSPAHNAVEANRDQQILVIDGLGNDDWSFFCAVTYPGAIIHDLKETDVTSGSPQEPSRYLGRAPHNYRRVELANLAERFPFPQSYFAVVVVRFPAAMPDAVLRMALSECKRVLVPGGYLELSLLDLDMANMGTITRHAIRDLKARMISVDSQVNLKPISDHIQNVLGQRGFENLNRCVVGVPVAGKVATSSGSRSSRSSRESSNQKGKEVDRDSGADTTRSRRDNEASGAHPPQGGNFSLSELVSDHSANGDAKIAKMMAKVGRWWYTRTYEWAVLPNGDLTKSIWSDKKMLHECKVRGSGFKLLIAYAQKPVEMRRRTLSEPVRPTAAVSGTRMMKRYGEVYGSEQRQ